MPFLNLSDALRKLVTDIDYEVVAELDEDRRAEAWDRHRRHLRAIADRMDSDTTPDTRLNLAYKRSRANAVGLTELAKRVDDHETRLRAEENELEVEFVNCRVNELENRFTALEKRVELLEEERAARSAERDAFRTAQLTPQAMRDEITQVEADAAAYYHELKGDLRALAEAMLRKDDPMLQPLRAQWLGEEA